MIIPNSIEGFSFLQISSHKMKYQVSLTKSESSLSGSYIGYLVYYKLLFFIPRAQPSSTGIWCFNSVKQELTSS